jgi:GNAT superfamily N-acetyltransferase
MVVLMIRDMEHKDISTLLEMGEKMHQEGHFKNTNYNKTKVTELFLNIINTDDKCCFVSEVNGVIIGFFMGYVYEYYFGDTISTKDLLLYVAKEHRGSSTGIKLVHAYIKWAESIGVDRQHIRLADSAEIDSKSVQRLFKHLGFREHGSLYVLGE